MTKDRPRNRPQRGQGPRRDFQGSGAEKRNGYNSKSPRFPSNSELTDGPVWIWGLHAAKAALANPARTLLSGRITRNAAARIDLDVEHLPSGLVLSEPREIDDELPPGAVHQGVALFFDPLEPGDLETVMLAPDRPLLILDQVTDPQNVGAILRSAAAFGFAAVIVQTRHAPRFSGALAKAATGAVETVREVQVVNVSRAIRSLVDAGWRVVGLAGDSETILTDAIKTHEPLALVLGAEGDGLRQGVAGACTCLARIPMATGTDSLNVSNAAAIAFYETFRSQTS